MRNESRSHPSPYAWARARQRIAECCMQAADVAIVPAAAGGPKGLILHSLDCWMSGEFLPQAPRQRTIIGVWRMAAAAFADPVATHQRLARLYTGQRALVRAAGPDPGRHILTQTGRAPNTTASGILFQKSNRLDIKIHDHDTLAGAYLIRNCGAVPARGDDFA